MAQSAAGQANSIGGRAAVNGIGIAGGGVLAPVFDFARAPAKESPGGAVAAR